MAIKSKLVASGAWTVTAEVLNSLSSFAVFAVLANLLPPAEFGVVAFATLFIEIGRVLVVAGISDALVQQRDWDDGIASTAFWINLATGIILSVLLAICASALAPFYGTMFIWVLAALSLDLVIEGFTAVHVAKLRRDFGFKQLAMRGMLARLISGVVGVSAALSGWGVWALVISRLIASLGAAVVLWRMSDFRPRFAFEIEHAKRFGPFALNQLGSQLLVQLNGQAGALVIGAFLGPAAIAQYRVGTRALGMITSMLINPLQQTALSAFSRLQERPDGVGSAFLRVVRMTSIASCPALLGAAAISGDLIELMFGPNWTLASYIFMACCFYIGAASISYFQVPALSGSGNSRISLHFTMVSCVGNLLFALVAAPFGPLWIAIGQALRPYVTLPITMRFLKKGIGVEAKSILAAAMPAYVCAVVMFGIVIACRFTFLDDAHILVRLASCIVIGALSYALVLRIFARNCLEAGLAELMPLVPAGFARRFFERRTRSAS